MVRDISLIAIQVVKEVAEPWTTLYFEAMTTGSKCSLASLSSRRREGVESFRARDHTHARRSWSHDPLLRFAAVTNASVPLPNRRVVLTSLLAAIYVGSSPLFKYARSTYFFLVEDFINFLVLQHVNS